MIGGVIGAAIGVCLTGIGCYIYIIRVFRKEWHK